MSGWVWMDGWRLWGNRSFRQRTSEREERMTVYALLVFDRHCVATFAAAYNGTSLGPLGESTLPNVLRPADGPEATLAHRQSLAHTVSPQADGAANELPFDELAKLIYGIVVSIRVMTRQLAGIRYASGAPWFSAHPAHSASLLQR